MEKKYFVLIFVGFCLIILFTQYYGSVDTASFSSPAKYFAGDYSAKIRSSHSYLWGFVNAPFVILFQSFIGFKILNLIVLSLIIYSVYYISGKDKRAFFMILFSPIIWYMAPWINSIQIASFLFLWSYFFMQKYDQTNKINPLIYSGILFGFAAAFWHAIFFFGIFFVLFFLYNKKLAHSFYYLVGILIGLCPLFLFDSFFFGFPFHSLLKNNFGTLSNLFNAGVYQKISYSNYSLFAYISLLIMVPFYFWHLFFPSNFKKNYKVNLFLITCFLILLKNPQIRFLLLIVPIMVLNLVQVLDKKKINRLILISLIISLVVFIPYEMQIKYDTNGKELKSFLENFPNIQINSEFPKQIINQDLIQISKEHPHEIFIVGNEPDDYQTLANIYWGDKVREFVSIQDYNLYLNDTNTLIEREFRSGPKNINDRREIWIRGGIGKPINDLTDYESINYAISLEEGLDLEGFKLVKEYGVLFLFEKI